jgi:hypothetical protein
MIDAAAPEAFLLISHIKRDTTAASRFPLPFA